MYSEPSPMLAMESLSVRRPWPRNRQASAISTATNTGTMAGSTRVRQSNC